MSYAYFISYNVIGGIVWTGLFLWTGYFFGSLPFIRDNFSIVILAIILISLMPPVIEYLRGKNSKPAPGIE